MGLQRIETKDGHRYELDGEETPGVTTLLNGGIPKPALTVWASGLVAKYVKTMPTYEFEQLRGGDPGVEKKLRLLPYTTAKKAAAKGTDVHRYAERLIKGWEVQVPWHLEGYVLSCVDFMNAWRPAPVLVEAVVGSRTHGYCGTVDLIADLPDGRRALLDYKTSGSGIYPETALQLAAYRWADFVIDKTGAEFPLAELGINCAYAIWVKEDGYEVRPLNTSRAVFDVFLSAAVTARATKIMKSWVGKPETWKAPAA